MATYFDEEGNEIDLPTPEELEAQNKETEELKTQLEEKEKALKGFEGKEFNFKKLRDMTEEEKAKFNEKELALKQQIEESTEKQQKMENQLIDNWKDKAIRSMVGTDEELKKKILESFDTLNIAANTEYEIGEKMVKAFQLATGSSPVQNPLSYQSFSASGSPDITTKGQTQASKEFADKFGISAEDRKKYKKGVNLI